MTPGTADAGRGQRPNAGRNPQRYRARRAQYRAERVDLRSQLYMPEIANRQNNRRSARSRKTAVLNDRSLTVTAAIYLTCCW
jgi:hypothetical protein